MSGCAHAQALFFLPEVEGVVVVRSHGESESYVGRGGLGERM